MSSLLGKQIIFTNDEARYKVVGIVDSGVDGINIVMKNVSETITFFDRRINITHEFYELLEKKSRGKEALLVSDNYGD